MPGGKPQRSTTFEATCVGGPERFARGRFVLAHEYEVVNESWWGEHRRVGLIVNCMRAGDVLAYPSNAATSQIVYVDARSPKERDPDFQRALPLVEQTLEAGQDVLVHCSQSFHRAPAIAAAFMKKLCGVSFQVVPP